MEQAALGAAEVWARRAVAALRAEGRLVAGGWPGTLSEARNEVRECLARERLTPSHEELELAARAAYARARDVWFSCADRSEDEDDGLLEVT